MAKNISAPLARTARLLDLVPYLNTHQGISLKDLAQRFDVSTAQMSSDLTTLWMCGLPGYTPLELMDLEFESGFVTIRNAPTLSRPRSISFDEGVALILGLDLLSASISEDRQDLVASINHLKQKLSEKIGLSVSLNAQPKSSPIVTAAIKESLSRNLYLEISYHSLYRDEITTRIVQPLELVEDSDNQYLRAFCFTAGSMRDFRVDRIIEAKIVADRPNTKNSSINSEPLDFTIAFKAPSRDVSERFNLDYANDEKTLQLSSYSQQWIERSVMASGGGVEVTKPLNIRSEVASKAQLILDRYKAL